MQPESVRTATRSPLRSDLLAAIGRDCTGAVQLLPPGETPDVHTIEARALSDGEIEAELRHVALSERFPVGDEEPLRISIAGIQEKTALLWQQGRWCRPLGATPTTHIFKLPLGRVGRGHIDMKGSTRRCVEPVLDALTYRLAVREQFCESFKARRRAVRMRPSCELCSR
jgi:serine/threonine-protein kinase HipA